MMSRIWNIRIQDLIIQLGKEFKKKIACDVFQYIKLDLSVV